MTDVLVVGAGKSGLAAARAAARAGVDVTLVDRAEAAANDPGVRRLPSTFVYAPVLARSGALAGVRAVSGRQAMVIEARAVVLAAGGIAGLWDADAPLATGDSLVLAAKAGAPLARLTELRVAEGRVWVQGGVVADRHGRTPVAGLFACGAATGGDVGGIAAGEWAASHLATREGSAPLAPEPDVDEPLAPSFAEAKMDRLRAVMNAYMPPTGARRPEEAFRLLHALKGEADDFARARVDAPLYALRQACEAALLLVAAEREARRRGAQSASTE